MLSKEDLKLYYDSRSVCEVLSGLTSNLAWIDKYKIILEDFITPTHRVLFTVLYNLNINGFSCVSLADIETYLANGSDKRSYDLFFKEGNKDNLVWLCDLIDSGIEYTQENFEYYCANVRKLSQLRAYSKKNFPIEDILDLKSTNEELLQRQKEDFDVMTMDDIHKFFLNRLIKAKEEYTYQRRDNIINAKQGLRELMQTLRESPDYGFNDISPELTAIFRGMRRGCYGVYSLESGCGKTRSSIKTLMALSAPRYWSFREKKFIPNPNGVNPVLYIGTELEWKELQPILVAFISGVNEKKIHLGITTEEEQERINEAMNIIDEMNFYLCDAPNYSIGYIEDLVDEYTQEHGIAGVILDYLELTSGMRIEYANATNTNVRNIRDDQILLDASDRLKQTARRNNVWIRAYTQVTDDAQRDYKVRNQSVIPNGKAVINKADIGVVGMRPKEPEIKIFNALTEKKKSPKPCNYIMNVYKNRGADVVDVKLFCYLNNGTGEFRVLATTDWFFNPIKIDKVFITFDELETPEVTVK